MFTLQCDRCAGNLNAPDEADGRRVTCKKCGHTFEARRPGSPPPMPMRTHRVRDDREAPAAERSASRKGLLLAVAAVATLFLFLVVCGGGGAAVYFLGFRAADSPPTAVAGNTEATSTPAVTVPANAPTIPPEEPEDADDLLVQWPRRSGKGYDVAFPGPFTTTRSKQPFAAAMVDMDSSVHVTSDNKTLTFAHYVVPKPKKTKKSLTPDAVVRQTIQTEAKQHGGSAEVRERNYTPRGGVGKELSILRKDSPQVEVVRFSLVDEDFYVQRVRGERITGDSNIVRAFFASLQLRRE